MLRPRFESGLSDSRDFLTSAFEGGENMISEKKSSVRCIVWKGTHDHILTDKQ